MAVKIRLKRMGKIRTPFYRVVVADARTKRDGRVIEEIGTYNPKADPSIITIDSDRAQYWLGVGAQPSEAVTALLKLTGDLQRSKGETAESTVKLAEPKRDKAEVFNEALKAVHGEPGTEAVTKKAAAKKAPAKKAAKGDEKAAKGDEKAAKADESAKKAEEPAAAESTETSESSEA
ncbi:30S ribosomal protein S16 [Mumia sp. zg.B53]|uniref:30S ribosomal protein S16 n=1 Tax=unclassified Mumia TaxID=2621872 RepID=UPI001C6DD768|nr:MULTISPECIES: 30S ribosomal protein S16 [unclassified Mumia]MBW9205538.1 30S ribosomal protein S16 [Mumia sp. zg.B17]MBW9208461.1 30S ribosomal protein S16 [Mumia sp. zg.B21]MBW9216418.1 30S ribosomal protein S16 [Mumia sp. zg.B53]MDD9347755.1 30S ribosomal protein S16 [Mumia sp.]